MNELIRIIVSGGTQPQRENFALKVARKHNLNDRRTIGTSGDYAIIRTWRNKKVVRNILNKEKCPGSKDLKVNMEIGGAW